MRVKTVTVVTRIGFFLAAAALVFWRPAGNLALAGVPAQTAFFSYAALALLTFAAFPTVRRSDLTWALLGVVGAMEGVRVWLVWNGDVTAFFQGLAGVAVVHAISFTERFRSSARRSPGELFSMERRVERRRRSIRTAATTTA